MNKCDKNSLNEQFPELFSALKRLEKDNNRLSASNKALVKKLNAKRYKVIDFFVDSLYSLIRRPIKNDIIMESNDTAVDDAVRVTENDNRIKGMVDIINVNFFDWDGEIIYKGGAERYVYDLACLLREMGYRPRILQCSNKAFNKEFQGVEVIGIGAGDRNDMSKNSSLYSFYCTKCEFIIASPLELACEIKGVPIIGINHGVNFDGDWNHYGFENPHLYDEYMNALRNVSSCVCVDTNFINWTRTKDYRLSLKEEYIPNYYDQKKFSECSRLNSDKVRFIYPRRIYNARGADITIKAFRKVIPKYKDKIIIDFVGQIDNEKIGDDLRRLQEKYPKNVYHHEYDMSEMSKAYEGADVVLVPTRYCEGTSLSCIEGMAYGATVVTTNVGGLTNLVIDNFNGRIISPTTDDLVNVIVELMEDPKLRERLAQNGRKVAEASFNKCLWENKWKKEIAKVLSVD